jgi:dTDP-D-glucose 4,6-dehydratase
VRLLVTGAAGFIGSNFVHYWLGAHPADDVGSGMEASITDADLVLGALGKSASLKTIVPDRPGHDRRYLLDSTRIH